MGIFDRFTNKPLIEELKQQANESASKAEYLAAELSSKTEAIQTDLKAMQSNFTEQLARALTIFPTYTAEKENQSFRTVDDIYSIVSYLAETAAMIQFYGYKVTKEETMKRYKAATPATKGLYRRKALEDLPESNTTAKFLKRLSLDDLVSFYLTLYLNGELFLYKQVIEFGPNAGTVIPVLMPGQFVSVIVTDTWPQSVIGYRYQDSYFNFDINATDVAHVKYFNPDPYAQNKFRGLSPLFAGRKRMARTNAAMNISVAQMQNGGLPGVIFEKTLDNGDLNKRKDDFAKYLNNSANANAPYWIDGDIGYIQVGSPLADMQLAELSNIDFKKFCNLYRMPAQLLNNDEGAKFDNMDSAEKRMYTNAIRPNVIRMGNAFSELLQLEARGEYIEADFSKVEVLQSDLKKQAEALNMIQYLSNNEKREAIGWDRRDDPLMDEIIIGNSNMLLSDLEGVEDVEPTKDYEQER